MKLFFSTLLLGFFLCFFSCGGKDKKSSSDKSSTEIILTTNSDQAIVPSIDTASLKDEASILTALEKVVDARIADTKKRKEDPAYNSHIMELMKLHTDILVSSNAYYKTISDRDKALEYGKKFDAIEGKLHTGK